jgi:hypothetical protein
VHTFFRVLPFLTPVIFSHAATIGASVSTANQNGTAITQPGTITSSMTAPIGGAQAEATVDFGSIYVFDNSNCGNASNCSAESYASFSDVLTILDASGFLQARPQLGAVRAFGDGDASSSFTFGSASGFFLDRYFGSPCLPAIASCTLQQVFTPGARIQLSGSASATASDFNPRDPNDGSETDWAQMGFIFAALDNNGQPLTGFHYTSDSGHDYQLSGGTFVANPEPATLFVMASGLSIFLWLRRRSRLS